MAVNKIWDKVANLTPTQKIATSLILKDAVGCALYVGQARRNKEFTPQQRSDIPLRSLPYPALTTILF